MQEEVEQRVVTLAINCTKLTEQELKKALVKLLQHLLASREVENIFGATRWRTNIAL